jgi:GNAT superfamily N-acetyltransferase
MEKTLMPEKAKNVSTQPEFSAQAETKPSLRIRAAKLGDVESMVELLRTLFALEPDFTFNPFKQRQGLVKLICQEQGKCVLVAEIGERLVGMCTAQTVISTAEGGLVGWVEDVVVAPAYRGKGVGKWLLITLESWAVAEGLKRLQLIADRDNETAREFYVHLGWHPTRLVVLRKPLV